MFFGTDTGLVVLRDLATSNGGPVHFSTDQEMSAKIGIRPMAFRVDGEGGNLPPSFMGKWAILRRGEKLARGLQCLFGTTNGA